MRTDRSCAWIISLALASAGGVAVAEDAAPAKPAVPSVADILDASGITATGYVDVTAAYQHVQSTNTDYNTFALQQAAFTLSKLPTSGFGALVNVVAGQNPYASTGLPLSGTTGTIAPGTGLSATSFYLMQAYGQYITGPLTVQFGKLATLAGAETWNPTTNSQVTRSLLFAGEPVTNTGIRLTYAATDQLNLILGANNGWFASEETSTGGDKTLEAGVAFTPSKTLSATAQVYYGRDNTNFGVKAGTGLADTVITWTAMDALTVGASADYGWVESTTTTPSADWWGVALYGTYTFSDQFHVSLRPEYLADRKGYLTFSGENVILKEATLTFAYDPVKSVEVRLEGRYDSPSETPATTVSKSAQGWLEAYYKF
jgi:hypothetical protein